MRRSRPMPPLARRMLPWLVGWFTFQALVALAGRVTAWQKNVGDESSTSIRRVFTHTGLELHPRNPQLSRVRLDLAMAGGELDLSGLPRPQAGIDVTVRAAMAGLAVRVPSDWRVWWEFRGIGGIGTDGALQRTRDEHAADLRVHAVVVLGGIGLEAG
ncbi:hypothetical protein [Blastococcus mobilis]|uniref:Cell wall-active antibiotics response 4TMS YvqF n=1 Tax=Blastococcus mobilis TaxID=1938746 RepID=A0A238XRS9_9ACTN|nr:hypothetical protein [Blastococcus mobilis]SNR61278.1 hypothetical protein SAMN06272737_11549 [Blastococcus mobilis]